jgi:hypothetical protein
MSKADTARAYYGQARAELNLRIQLRDNVLLFYLGAIATLLGVALTQGALQILLVVPYVAVGVTLILAQHHTAIGAMVEFFSSEFDQFLRGLSPAEDAVQWDNSKAAKGYAAHAMFQRTLGHTIILLLPCISSLLINWSSAISSQMLELVLWWGGFISTIFAGWIIWRTHRFRNAINKKLNWVV